MDKLKVIGCSAVALSVLFWLLSTKSHVVQRRPKRNAKPQSKFLPPQNTFSPCWSEPLVASFRDRFKLIDADLALKDKLAKVKETKRMV